MNILTFNYYFPFSIILMATTILLVNVQGLRQPYRRTLVFNYFKSYDIIFIQETHWTDDIKTDIERD